ncbi:MAG TPA: cellulase family glycosylhydrolase [Polyangia bacterium]
MSARLVCALALLALAAGCGGAASTEDPTLAPAPVTTRRLQAAGRDLRDEHGRLVLLRGFNAGGRAKMPPYLPFDAAPADTAAAADAFFATLEGLGANVVRLTLSWEALEPVRGARDLDYWQRYRALVDAAHAHGLAVIVEAHQDVYASPFCGDGLPLWTLGDVPHGLPRYDCGALDWALPYFDPASPVNQAFQRFWDDADGIQTDFVAMWRFVATELDGHPGVAAFEVLNEPGPGAAEPAVFESTALPAFHARVGAAIRAQAGDVVVLGGAVAGAASDAHAVALPDLPGFVYAPHYYDSVAYLGIDLVDPERIRAGIVQSIALPGDPAVPVVIGEWGVPNRNPGKAAYVEAMVAVFDELRLHAVAWDAQAAAERWNGEDFSVLGPDGAEASWADAVARPYPRAVAGASFRFGFDPAAARLWLEVDGAAAGVTEVFVPVRHFGAAPRVATSARWRWLPDAQTLLVAAAPGGTYRVDVAR